MNTGYGERVAEKMFFSEEEQSEPEQRVAGAMVRLLVTAGNFRLQTATPRMNQKLERELLSRACRKFTAVNPGFNFGQMLATAAHNLEQLELELRTILLGKMAGQVQHQLLSKTFLLLLKLRV